MTKHPGIHRHSWINTQGGASLSGRVPNGTIRECSECHVQQVKTQGRWQANPVRTAVAIYDSKESA